MKIKLLKYITFFTFLICSFSSFSQQNIDFKTVNASITIDALRKTVAGDVTYSFTPTQKKDSIWLNAYAMKIDHLTLDNKTIHYTNADNKITVFSKFKANLNYTLKLHYTVSPKKAMYFVGWQSQGRKQVWTQGQGKDNSHWIPLYDEQTDKVLFEMQVIFDKDYTVISNGLLQSCTPIDSKHKQWHYKMNKPMSSYLLMLAIGNYKKLVHKSKSGVLLEDYYYPKDSLKALATYKYSKQIFNFLEKEIGVNYPWKVYRNIPVQDFLYGGMENTSATIYNEREYTDSIGFKDRRYVNVAAHELAHQWFGDMVTAKSSKHHWLHEGFATYYALLTEKAVFGNSYFEAKIYNNAQKIKAAATYDSIPVLNGKASSLSFYQKGAWVLYNLNRKIGKKAFDKAIVNYLKKYAFKIVTTADFIAEINKASNTNNQAFFDQWLKQTTVPKDNLTATAYNQTRALITRNANDYNKLRALFIKYNNDSSIHSSIKVALLNNLFALKPNLDKTLIKTILNTKVAAIPLHKTLTQNIKRIPKDLLTDFEKVLSDKSYQTIEQTLTLLWIASQKDNNKYLEQTKNTIGFNDYNIHTLWLFLAIIDSDYQPKKTPNYLNELTALTSSSYRFSIRQHAFDYLNQLEYYSPQFYHNLIAACQHFNWRFASPSRELLKEILSKPANRQQLKDFEQLLNKDDKLFLKKYF